MPAFSFKKQFVEPIQAGTKHHTIRGERVDGRVPAKVGDQLSLFCGMRTKGCFRILPGTVLCTKVQPIEIGREIIGLRPFVAYVKLAGERLDKSECEALAVADGFANFEHMMAFWDSTHFSVPIQGKQPPFKGYIIHWR